MKRIGLIDNLVDINSFLENKFHTATAAEVMTATGGNTGNVAFVFGTRKMLKNPITRIGWGWTPEVVRQRVDHLVVCCANQIGPHADLAGWADRLEQFGLPATFVGLGAQADDFSKAPAIPVGTLKFLEVATRFRSDSGAANIAVRGEFTKGVLAGVGTASEAAGCPSLMISKEPALGAAILARQPETAFRQVVVAAGNPWHGPSAFIERLLVEIVERFAGTYILQHPVSMLNVAFGEHEQLPPETVKRFLAVYGERFDVEGLFAWYRQHAAVFVDVPNWLRFLSRADCVLGPRYHGVALGMQAGKPGYVITIDSRTQELCDGTGIKSLPVAEALQWDADRLVEFARWSADDAMAFDANRSQKAVICADFLRSNGLEPSDHLTALAAP